MTHDNVNLDLQLISHFFWLHRNNLRQQWVSGRNKTGYAEASSSEQGGKSGGTACASAAHCEEIEAEIGVTDGFSAVDPRHRLRDQQRAILRQCSMDGA